jgi:hypothetical protein
MLERGKRYAAEGEAKPTPRREADRKR